MIIDHVSFQAMKWRKQNNIDTIVQEKIGNVEKEFPFTFDSRDRLQQPGRHYILRVSNKVKAFSYLLFVVNIHIKILCC